jgi:hypothetical protein
MRVCIHACIHTCVHLCVCDNIVFIVQICGVSLCFMIHYSQIICWFMDILLGFCFCFSSVLDDTILGNTHNHVKD